MKDGKNWKYVALVLGVIFTFLGVITVIFPRNVLAFLPMAMGVILIVTGVSEIISGISDRTYKHSANMDITKGIVYILLALIFLFRPRLTIEFVIVFIGVLALFNGGAKVASSFGLSSVNLPWGLVLLDGIIQITLGMLILIAPFKGAITLTILMGIYLLYFGLAMIATGFIMKKEEM